MKALGQKSEVAVLKERQGHCFEQGSRLDGLLRSCRAQLVSSRSINLAFWKDSLHCHALAVAPACEVQIS